MLTNEGASLSVPTSGGRRPKRAGMPRGEGGIRTPDAGITDVTVFETAAFNHSATSPRESVSTRTRPFNHDYLAPQALITTLYLYIWFIRMTISIPRSSPSRSSQSYRRGT